MTKLNHTPQVQEFSKFDKLIYWAEETDLDIDTVTLNVIKEFSLYNPDEDNFNDKFLSDYTLENYAYNRSLGLPIVEVANSIGMSATLLSNIYKGHRLSLKKLIDFAKNNKTSLIPRTAGTSLAGQCVGSGIVVDVSKHFNKIISLDKNNKTVTVQPGVVRDQLNNYLKPFGLFFGPNTSTSNRCMIGGMVGNNSSGSTSIQYGVTRDKVLSLKTLLSDGSEAEVTG